MYTREDIIDGVKHMQSCGNYYITPDAEEFANRIIKYINKKRDEKYIDEVFDQAVQDLEEKL